VASRSWGIPQPSVPHLDHQSHLAPQFSPDIQGGSKWLATRPETRRDKMRRVNAHGFIVKHSFHPRQKPATEIAGWLTGEEC
jgi:hypothetical protein